jgi:hypothetical protein
VKDADANVIRFIQLYRCNERSYGAVKPPAFKGLTIKGHPIPREAYRAHLEGEVGLGGVPILDDGTCWWAAIDFDVHGPNGRDFNIFELAAKIEKYRYPLILCRSKSGGAHAYVFFAEPTPAAVVRPLLSRWAQVLGWKTVEVFPKQSNLEAPLGEKERPLGNWLNLPYFDVKQTQRYCISGGKEVSFEYFLELAEGGRYRVEADQAAQSDEYTAGPPCLQEMIRQRVDEGNRNNAVFQAAVFLKRARPEDWKQRVAEFNALALTSPLNFKELRQIQGSVNRRDYNYKCREEPCKSFCNRELCGTREFGITADDTKANELPPFDRIEKVIATPIRWVLHIKGQQIELSSQELFDFSRVRMAVYEKLNVLLPRMKAEDWDVHLREVAERAKTRHETTIDDTIFQKMCDFVRRAHQDRATPEDNRREALLRKMPALISFSNTQFKPRGQVDEKGALDEIGRTWYYAFRAQDFIDYMRRHKALTVQEHQVHTILHRVLDGEAGDCLRDRFRIGERVLRNVWCVPEQIVATETVPEKKFIAEY